VAEAPELEALYQKYEDDGFIVITLLGENMDSQTPSQSDLEEWADSLGVTHPVVADPNFDYTFGFIDGNSIGLPSMHIIAAGGEVVARDIWADESDVQSYLP